MRALTLFLACLVMLTACRFNRNKRIKGNGNVVTETRDVSGAERIRLKGIMDVEITQGENTAVRVIADENILPYIVTKNNGDVLEINMKPHINLIGSSPITVQITTRRLNELMLTGSGNILGKNKFTGSDKMRFSVSGIGDIKMDLNAPEVNADVSGSGSITLSGETRDARIKISGIGNCYAEDLKSENAVVKIAGSGDVKIFADRNLDVSIAGLGSVFYRGEPIIKQKISGSGEIKRLPE